MKKKEIQDKRGRNTRNKQEGNQEINTKLKYRARNEEGKKKLIEKRMDETSERTKKRGGERLDTGREPKS
jgi:hypothetical protein